MNNQYIEIITMIAFSVEHKQVIWLGLFSFVLLSEVFISVFYFVPTDYILLTKLEKQEYEPVFKQNKDFRETTVFYLVNLDLKTR